MNLIAPSTSFKAALICCSELFHSSSAACTYNALVFVAPNDLAKVTNSLLWIARSFRYVMKQAHLFEALFASRPSK
jgi:hypothetical protein